MPKAETILAELEIFGVKLGLSSTRRLLRALGSPEASYPVVLVGGTNGKGSTATVLAEILAASGRRVGLYTSPHLEVVEERVRVGGTFISPEALGDRLERVVALGERELGHPPTYFEALTVAAYLYFREERVEVAVMEVGLGGRLDATNAADPLLSLVTSISLDHTRVLGSSVDLIAREKAGIFRAGRKALCWLPPEPARGALVDEARRRGAVLVDVSRDTSWQATGTTLSARRTASLTTAEDTYHVDTSLVGAYQMRNLATAIRAAETLRGMGFEIARDHVEKGVRRSWWPGRCELVPLPQGSLVLLEAAHNQEGMSWLRRHLDEVDAGDGWRVIFGALDDKAAGEMLATISTAAERVILTPPPSPRAIPPAKLLPADADDRWCVTATPEEALDEALEPGGRILVCGSIYLVGDVRGVLRRRFGVPRPTTSSSSAQPSAPPGLPPQTRRPPVAAPRPIPTSPEPRPKPRSRS